MADHGSGKAKRLAKSQAPASVGARTTADRAPAAGARSVSNAPEVDRLRLELDAALERIAVLEDERAQLANRIEWALQTLQELMGEDGRES